MSRCATSGKQHLGKCLARTNGFFWCRNEGHKMREFPNLKKKGKEVDQSPSGGYILMLHGRIVSI